MLLGEYSAQLDLPMGNKALGLHMTYYNPNLGLTGILIRSQLESGDELNLNTHGILPGISFTVYPKGDMKGFYVGGLMRYKIAVGDVYFKDKYTGGSAFSSSLTLILNLKKAKIHYYHKIAKKGKNYLFPKGWLKRVGI